MRRRRLQHVFRRSAGCSVRDCTLDWADHWALCPSPTLTVTLTSGCRRVSLTHALPSTPTGRLLHRTLVLFHFVFVENVNKNCEKTTFEKFWYKIAQCSYFVLFWWWVFRLWSELYRLFFTGCTHATCKMKAELDTMHWFSHQRRRRTTQLFT